VWDEPPLVAKTCNVRLTYYQLSPVEGGGVDMIAEGHIHQVSSLGIRDELAVDNTSSKACPMRRLQ